MTGGREENTMKLPHTTAFQKTIIGIVSTCSVGLAVMIGTRGPHRLAELNMAEEVKQPTFPDMSNGIDYTKYTVEGDYLVAGVISRPREHPRRRNCRRALRAAELVHAHSEVPEAGWVVFEVFEDKDRTLRVCSFPCSSSLPAPCSSISVICSCTSTFSIRPSFPCFASSPPSLQGDDAYKRFMLILKWYLSSWHYKTHVGEAMLGNAQGCKKPYNPIIGETFSCIVDTAESRVSYVAEQCGHHPPISGFYLENQKKGYCANGYIWTKSHFTGNSACGSMLGNIEVFLPKFDEVVAAVPRLNPSTTQSFLRSRARACSSARCACN